MERDKGKEKTDKEIDRERNRQTGRDTQKDTEKRQRGSRFKETEKERPPDRQTRQTVMNLFGCSNPQTHQHLRLTAIEQDGQSKQDQFSLRQLESAERLNERHDLIEQSLDHRDFTVSPKIETQHKIIHLFIRRT